MAEKKEAKFIEHLRSISRSFVGDKMPIVEDRPKREPKGAYRYPNGPDADEELRKLRKRKKKMEEE